MLTRLLTILPLLCPLLMLVCMWAMRSRPTAQRQGGQQELPTADRVAQLERELAELRTSLAEASPVVNDVPAPGPDPSRGARNGTPVQPA
jgi:hypothetical protein